jgi:hypothetical protein
MLGEIGDKLGWHTEVAEIHGGDIADMHRRITVQPEITNDGVDEGDQL